MWLGIPPRSLVLASLELGHGAEGVLQVVPPTQELQLGVQTDVATETRARDESLLNRASPTTAYSRRFIISISGAVRFWLSYPLPDMN